MLCEATVVAMLERGREPLAVGRRRRRATKAQWRALLRRDSGCARPGCPETRVERLHAHHLRHWLFGGPTDIDNLVLLCDVDHGLVHEHDLVLSRRDGRLIVTAPDGTRLWGSADAAFTAGLNGGPPVSPVHGPSEVLPGRPGGRSPRPPRDHRRRARPVPGPRGAAPAPGPHPGGPGATRRLRRSRAGASPLSAATESRRLDRILFPDGAPPRPEPRDLPYERMDMAWAIGVLMGNRELVRRLEAERRSGG